MIQHIKNAATKATEAAGKLAVATATFAGKVAKGTSPDVLKKAANSIAGQAKKVYTAIAQVKNKAAAKPEAPQADKTSSVNRGPK